MRLRGFSFSLAFLISCATASFSSAAEVSFRRDIAPILQQRCAACHGEETTKGAYRVDTFEHLQKAGESELPAVTSGNPEESELYRLLVEPSASDRMPQKADALPEREINLIKEWIAQGAKFDGQNTAQSITELAREVHLRAAPNVYPTRLPITALAFSPDGRQLAVSGYYEVLIWDLNEGRLARRIAKMPERITSIAWSAHGWLAIAGGAPSQWGTVALVAPGESTPERYLCDHPETTLAVAFRPDGKQLVVGSGDRTMRFFETESGKELRVLRQHSDWVQQVEYAPSGKFVVSGSRDRTAKLVNADTGDVEATFADHQSAVTGAVFIDEWKILSLDLARRAHVWHSRSGGKGTSWTSASDARQKLALWSGYAVVAGGTKEPELRDIAKGTVIRTLVGHRAPVQTMAASHDGELLATGSFDGEVLVWRKGCETYQQRIHPAPLALPQMMTGR